MMSQEIRPQPKPVREIDADYTAYIKSMVCCLPVKMFIHDCCFGPRLEDGRMHGIQPHHVPKAGLKGMGTKVSDKRQVPVCHAGHRYCEQHPLEVKGVFAQPYPSLQKSPPVAPSREELSAVGWAVLEQLKQHQNKHHCHVVHEVRP